MEGMIQGYHGTCQSAALSIKKDGFFVKTNDKHWLGNGVYFYLDASLAKRWACGLTTKFGTTECDDPTPVILHTTINYRERTELIDVRDKDDYDFLKNKYKEYLCEWQDKLNGKSIKREFSMPRFRCMFFDWLHRTYPIEIVIAGFYIPKPKSIYSNYTLEELGIPFIEYQMCVFERSLISLDSVEVI